MSYSPTLGRFLETDPAEYIDGPNEYQLEESTPEDGLDPTGTALILTGIGEYGAATFPDAAGFGISGASDQEIAIGIGSYGIDVGSYESLGVGPAWGAGGGWGAGPEFGLYPFNSDPADLAGWGYSGFVAGFSRDLFVDPPFGQPGGAGYGLPYGPGLVTGFQIGAQINYSWEQDLWGTSWGNLVPSLASGDSPIGSVSTCPLSGDIPLLPNGFDIPNLPPADELPQLGSSPEVPSPTTPNMVPSWNFPTINFPTIPDFSIPSVPLIDQMKGLIDSARGILRPF